MLRIGFSILARVMLVCAIVLGIFTMSIFALSVFLTVWPLTHKSIPHRRAIATGTLISAIASAALVFNHNSDT